MRKSTQDILQRYSWKRLIIVSYGTKHLAKDEGIITTDLDPNTGTTNRIREVLCFLVLILNGDKGFENKHFRRIQTHSKALKIQISMDCVWLIFAVQPQKKYSA